MQYPSPPSKRIEHTLLGILLLLFTAISITGITWGLPSRKIDKYLFDSSEPWPGEKIYRLAGVAAKFSATRGADVDLDPLIHRGARPVSLTATDQDVAKILLRYRLYTYQPDEMITMMALSGMDPRRLQLDPRLYQYGGLFIYPVGALIAGCGAVGLIDVHSDVVYYLDNPDEFGKFYIVARAYAACWGLLGVVVVFAIGKRLGGSRAGLLAALLFTLMPVVVCMAHEGKPHLPGAVLMMMAVLFGMRHLKVRTGHPTAREYRRTEPRSPALDAQRQGSGSDPAAFDAGPVGAPSSRPAHREWWLMCICCGAAAGMVLSSAPIFILIPLVAWLGITRKSAAPHQASQHQPVPRRASAWGSVLKYTILGVAAASLIYLVTNPYIAINAVFNRDVLRSNFGNSLAMYEIARIGQGFVRVLELTVEGATLPIVILGVVAVIAALLRKRSEPSGIGPRSGTDGVPVRLAMLLLTVPAALIFGQFVLIGAGKPAEYGRFGVFTNTALAIGTACVLARRWTQLREIVNWIPAVFVVIWVGFFGGGYLANFHVDTTPYASRSWDRIGPRAPSSSSPLDSVQRVVLLAEPAPYCCPPLPFARLNVLLYSDAEQAMNDYKRHRTQRNTLFIRVVDRLGSSVSRSASRPTTWWNRFAKLFGSRAGSSAVMETPISWANKPFEMYGRFAGSGTGK